MRKIIGFIFLCICLSHFYYRYSQVAYEEMGESVAFQQLDSIYTAMDKVKQNHGDFYFNLDEIPVDFFKSQFFGFNQKCFPESNKTQSLFLANGKFGLKNNYNNYNSNEEVAQIINQYSMCNSSEYIAVVTHNIFNRTGIYTINQNHHVEVIRSSRLEFWQWLRSIFD